MFVIIDVRQGVEGMPTTAYEAVEQIEADGREIQRAFKHIPCSIEAEEVEEVGVEHLLRDINDPSTSTLALQIKQKIVGLSGLVERLQEINAYLLNISSKRLPINNQIIYNLQNILNLLPNLNIEELVRCMLVKTNDMHLVMYVSSLVRSVIALHGLLSNKIKYRDVDEVLDRNAGVDGESKKQAAVENGADQKEHEGSKDEAEDANKMEQ